jgi:HAD superfamily hydrolase (TIGR01549 family)
VNRASAIIFDLDGTLTRPYLDFDAMRAEIGVTGPILEAIAAMSPTDRARAEAILLRHEWDAARNATLYDGAVEVVGECRRRGHRTAVLTRNARIIVDYLVERFGFGLDAIRTREDGAVKPSAEPVLSICEQLHADPAASWVVGDFLFDIMSGRAAGARTVLMIGDNPAPDFASQADHVIRRLRDLLPLLAQA